MSEMQRIQVLDHGYVALIETWGSDERFIEAARMSTNKGFQGWETDAKLLSFLYKNKHMTPFEMGGLIFEVSAPIFVFREWHRHRVPFSYNEMSARYIPLPDENYTPSVADVVARSAVAANTANRQASGVKEISVERAERDVAELGAYYRWGQNLYERFLADGWPKELARVLIPVGRYSRMRASANVRGWLNFLQLRMAPGAQWEIRQYAGAVGTFVKEKFPRTWELFERERIEDGQGSTR